MKILLTKSEQTTLRKLIREHKPRRVLEIGTGYGGSAVLIDKVLPTSGVLVTVDPKPQPTNFLEDTTKTQLLKGESPQAIAQASALAGGLFDFVFIDGNHTTEGVSADIRGVLEYTTPDAYLLFHDAFNENVSRAIGDAAGDFEDLGMLTSEKAQSNGQWWGGLRLLRKR